MPPPKKAEPQPGNFFHQVQPPQEGPTPGPLLVHPPLPPEDQGQPDTAEERKNGPLMRPCMQAVNKIDRLLLKYTPEQRRRILRWLVEDHGPIES